MYTLLAVARAGGSAFWSMLTDGTFAQAYKETWDLRLLPPHLQAEAWDNGTVAVHPDGPEQGAKLAVEMKPVRKAMPVSP